MSSGWSLFVTLVTLLSIAGMVWLLMSNRNIEADGRELDHEFDGIREFDNPLPAWWVGLFIATVIFGLGYVFYYPALGNMTGAGGWTSEKELIYQTEKHEERFSPLYASYASMSPEELMLDKKAMQTGRRLFLNNCSTCHGVAAKGGKSFPNLTDDEWIWGSDFNAIKLTIKNGRQAAMPGWDQVLQPDQLQAITELIRSNALSDSSVAADDVAMTTYKTLCIACHGPDGKGNAALGAPDLTNDIWLYGDSAEEVMHSIAKGRAGMMPAQGEIIGEDKVHLLAAYVLYLSSKEMSSESGKNRASHNPVAGD